MTATENKTTDRVSWVSTLVQHFVMEYLSPVLCSKHLVFFILKTIVTYDLPFKKKATVTRYLRKKVKTEW